MALPKYQVTRVKSNEFAGQVMNFLNDWDASMIIAVNVAGREAAEDAAEKLHHVVSTPQNFKGKKYRGGWTVSQQQLSRGHVKNIVHNKKEYRLAHLLEYGHDAVVNGKTVGSAPAYEHIYPIAEKMPEVFEEKLLDILGTPGGSIK